MYYIWFTGPNKLMSKDFYISSSLPLTLSVDEALGFKNLDSAKNITDEYYHDSCLIVDRSMAEILCAMKS